MKKFSIVSVMLTAIAFSLAGCFSAKTATTPNVQKLTASYDYSPPEDGFTKSKDVSFILIAPSFAKDFDYINYEPFTTFSKSMANDYVEMLTKRGYKYIGPVNSYGEIVYSDKKNTDMILESELDFDFTGGTPFKYISGTTLLTNTPYTKYFANGELVMTGKINFFLSEPFTHTKVWVKSIPVETQTINVKSQRTDYTSLEAVRQDPAVWNAFVGALQRVYVKTLQTAWTYLDPEELKEKKKEAMEIRNNSSFQKN